MEIYLPIAEMSVNIFGILALGGVTGILSGMFGVGGGFLMTPFLIFLGIPPAISVASSANQIVASSFSGFLAHWRRNNVDFKMGWVLLAGGMVGSTFGVWLFKLLKSHGHIDLVISLSYVFFLGTVGVMMGMESFRNLAREKTDQPVTPRKSRHNILHTLPWKTRFPRSQLYISAITPLGIGFLVGIMVSIMGIGGGFFMIPAMIYLLGMPTSVVIGTSLFQIIFITANVTILQAASTQTVDAVLAILLLTGSVVGAQMGTKIGAKIPAVQLRAMLALLVVGMALKLAFGLFARPDELFTVVAEGR